MTTTSTKFQVMPLLCNKFRPDLRLKTDPLAAAADRFTPAPPAIPHLSQRRIQMIERPLFSQLDFRMKYYPSTT